MSVGTVQCSSTVGSGFDSSLLAALKIVRQFLVLKATTQYRVPTSTGKPGKMRQLFPVREKSGNFEEKKSKSQGILNESGKTVIHKLKFNQSRIKILLNFSH